MSALARIKKTAAQHEQERQYDKALALYARLLDGAEAGDEEVDVGLFNRAGDLALRLGDVPRAVGYFERALDLYAAGGLLNNAVALGVKILRHAPTHLSAYYTLGVLYSRKGFASDARHHLLTYVVQMQRAGRTDEAGRVLVEVGASCDDQAALQAAVDAYGALGGDPAQGAVLVASADDGMPRPASTMPDMAAFPVAGAVPGARLIDYGPAPAPTRGAPVCDAPGDLPAACDAAHAAAAADDVGDLDVDLNWEPFAINSTVPDVSVSFVRDADDALAWPTGELDTGELDTGEADMGERDMVEPSMVEPSMVDELAFELPDEWLPACAGDPVGDVPAVGGYIGRGPSFVSLDTPEVAGGAAPRREHPTAVAPLTWGGAVEFTDDRAPAHTAAAPRWAATLPGDPPPLRLRELAHVVAASPSAMPSATRSAPPAAPAVDEEPLDLGAWLRGTTSTMSTRLTTAVVPQSGDEQADFDATLRAFTSGVARAVEHEDFESHYDLGVAFREMGLLDEAIVEFQRAALAPGRPLRTLETLAQCFLDVGQPELALTTLHEPAVAAAASGVGDAALVAVHYLMGAAAEALGRPGDARCWFVRVVATDLRFRDAASRLAALPPPTPVR